MTNAMTDKQTESTDWQKIRDRLARVQEALNATENISAKLAQTILDQRARDLARVPDETPDTSEIIEIIKFQLCGERFALETRFVREVITVEDITPVPFSQEHLVGVTNLRGEVLAVMDLSRLFELTSKNGDQKKTVIVLGKDRVEYGVLVDHTDEVTTLHLSKILAPPASFAGAAQENLRGVTNDALLVVDGDSLMADERLYIDDTD